MTAYVLVQTAANVSSIADFLRVVRGVLQAEDLRGPYAAIALARSDARRPLDRILTEIRGLPGVTRAVAAPLNRSRSEMGKGEAA